MYQSKIFLFFIFLFSFIHSGIGQKEITLEEVFDQQTFKIETVPGFNAMKNGKDYSRIDKEADVESINIYDLISGKKKSSIFEKPAEMKSISDYIFSEDEKKILIFTDRQPIYRRSILYKVWVYDIESGSLESINDDKILHATFNPQGNKVAYVKENNIYLSDLKSGETIQVTFDGKNNEIINGNCDWVYEEEFSFSRAYKWSNDGKYIAFYRFDEREVKEFTMTFYEEGENYPNYYTYKYPKAGEDNSIVTIHLYNIESSQTTNVDIGDEKDQYIPRIFWSATGNNLCVFRMNRHQNKLEMILHDAENQQEEIIYTEENRYYIDINDNLTFLNDGESFLITSEKNGFNHLYKYNWVKDEWLQLTKGEYDIDKIIGIDIKKSLVYFTAGMDDPKERKLYSIDFKGKKTKTLTPEPGVHIATPAGAQYFLIRHATINQVPTFKLINTSGKVIRTLEDNQALANKMSEYAFSDIEFTQFPNEEGILLNAWMIKPKDFDASKKYPVLMYQYSGPGSQEVMDRFPINNFFWHQMMAQKGYIVICVDGTGTGGRGEEFKKKTYMQLGNLESNDQIFVAKQIADLPFVDAERVGIWGWSYGGFMSAICVMKGAEVFKTAVSVAPVTNWRFYDNIYTERFMRTPQENPEGYDLNAPEKMVDLLKGNLLIIHGVADDNVHFQNAAVLTAALVKANKQFESEYYPNKNHSIYGGKTREQLFRKITNYLLEKL